MTRICHLITGLPAHGAERMLYKLLSGMDRERFEPTVLSLMDKGTVGPAIEALGIPVLTVDLPRGRPHPAGLLRLIRLVRAANPEILQGWMYHGNLAATLAARFVPGRPPVLWNIRQSLYDLRHEKRLTRWLVQLSAWLSGSSCRVIYNSLTSARQHEARGFRPDRRVFIPNGFAVDDFAPDPALRVRVRQGWGVDEQQIVIGLAARYHPMKDHENFLQAAAKVAEWNDQVRLVLAGLDVDAGNTVLQRRIGALGLGERITLLGEQRDMRGFYQGLDIAVLTSAWGEGFPNVLGEAMASGLPCVTTAVGDAAAVVGDAGRAIPPGDAAALAEALSSLAGDQLERTRLGRLARERMRQYYSLPAIVSQYEDLYSALTKTPCL